MSERIRCVIADCSYCKKATSFKGLYVCRHNEKPHKPVLALNCDSFRCNAKSKRFKSCVDKNNIIFRDCKECTGGK